MPKRSPSAFRAALALLLAVAQPAMALLAHCTPGPASEAASCEHSRPDHGEHGSDGDDSQRSGECVSCCCLPSGALASATLDPAALLGPRPQESVPDQRIVESARSPLPRLLPFANAPPAVA